MRRCTEPFWAWPGWGHLRYFAILALYQTCWFALIYGGAELFTANRSFRVRVHISTELTLPFVPWMVAFYMSIYLLFVAAPFILRTRPQLRGFTLTLAVVTFFAGICFLLLPAETAYPAPQDLGIWEGLFRFADWLNLEYNLVPSLHVAMSIVCIAVYSGRAGAIARVVIWAWGVALGVSTLLTYQHHLIDVLSGFLLGIVSTKLVYDRLSSWAPAESVSRTPGTGKPSG